MHPRGYRTGHELLEDLTPTEWAYWCVSEKLDPDGGQRELASLVASQVINSIMSIGASFGGGTIDEADMLPADAFVPFRHGQDDKLRDSLKSLESLRGL